VIRRPSLYGITGFRWRWAYYQQATPDADGVCARRHDLTIVTGNDKDFRRPGLKVFNPFKEFANIGS
jgi:hypothetical protein